MLRVIYTLILSFGVVTSYAWNGIGHEVVAQIAYDNLSHDAKKMCFKYLRTKKHNSPNSSFVVSSIWMDQIRGKQFYWYDVMHYIDIPYASDESALPAIESTNAVLADARALIETYKCRRQTVCLTVVNSCGR
ncbi:MAG: S1/P1 nuclease [Legionella sp.]